MSKIIVGKVAEQQVNKRGWVVGQFFEEESPFKDENVEIYVKNLSVHDQSDKLHKHPHGKEYLIVFEGKLKIQIGEDIVVLSKGDYVCIPNNTPDKILEIIDDVTLVGVRYPSIPDNKVFLE